MIQVYTMAKQILRKLSPDEVARILGTAVANKEGWPSGRYHITITYESEILANGEMEVKVVTVALEESGCGDAKRGRGEGAVVN